jgi:hypothetical protein
MELGEKSWGPAATLCANQEKKNGDRPGARTRTANWSSDSTARNRSGARRNCAGNQKRKPGTHRSDLVNSARKDSNERLACPHAGWAGNREFSCVPEREYCWDTAEIRSEQKSKWKKRRPAANGVLDPVKKITSVKILMAQPRNSDRKNESVQGTLERHIHYYKNQIEEYGWLSKIRTA